MKKNENFGVEIFRNLPNVPNPSFSTPMDIPKNFDLVHIWAVNWIDFDLFSA